MINVIIAGNRTITQEGVSSILLSTDDISIQGYAENNFMISDLMHVSNVDVIILDHNFINDFDLKDAAKRTEMYGSARFLVVSDYHQKSEIQELIASGINNQVSNECSRAEFIEAVYATARVENYLCSHMRHVVFGNKLIAKEGEKIPSLSDRETEIVQLISIGLSNKEIAEKLFLSFHTIKTHRKNIIRKLGFTFKNASELALLITYLNDIVI